MKNIKEITISVLIIITFYTVLTSIFKNEPAETVWEIKAVRMADDLGVLYSINKVTGEVRLHFPEDGKIKTIK
ncbi:hypothetical protein N9484_08635 [Polaribacter sp.]|nr:hypothetical protein [Polaribacter sp.]